jgi:periplasmic divalent cation tolerance protein
MPGVKTLASERSGAACTTAGTILPMDDARPLLVVTTVATREQALTLARSLVQQRLAACAQVSATLSVYRWQGAVHEEPEHRVLFKTVAARYAEVEAAIRAQHPYELPAIHAVATEQAWAPYAEWVADGASG